MFVNTGLRLPEYFFGMPNPTKKTGSPKGQPKPHKRPLDKDVFVRLASVIEQRGISIPQMANDIGCTRQVLYNYKNGVNTTMDVQLFVDICEYLGINGHWLIYGPRK